MLLAAGPDNMWAKQAAALLDACPNIQPMYDLADEEDHSSPPPKEEQMWSGEAWAKL